MSGRRQNARSCVAGCEYIVLCRWCLAAQPSHPPSTLHTATPHTDRMPCTHTVSPLPSPCVCFPSVRVRIVCDRSRLVLLFTPLTVPSERNQRASHKVTGLTHKRDSQNKQTKQGQQPIPKKKSVDDTYSVWRFRHHPTFYLRVESP